jgi:hypothetical protein
MGALPFPPDAELTGPDRIVLGILQKEYELHKDASVVTSDAAEDSDNSATKHSKFVAPSPEGKTHFPSKPWKQKAC